jgi:hypothetical protein
MSDIKLYRMKSAWNSKAFLTIILFVSGLLPRGAKTADAEQLGPNPGGNKWEIVQTIGEPYVRHEAAFVELGGKFYLLGGRRVQPVSIYDPKTNAGTEGAAPPIEVHHVQPVVLNGKIHLVGAMTGPFPNETGLDRVLIYDPKSDNWSFSHEIPEKRRRGGAGASVRDGKIYLAGGIVNGHIGGFVDWFDEYDPATGDWRKLPSAPHKRDHFQSVIVGDGLYCAGGRMTSRVDGRPANQMVDLVDVYDFASGEWSVVEDPIPTSRAGTSTMALGKEVLVLGGESNDQQVAHNEVEALSTETEKWKAYPSMARGRHGSGAFLWEGYIYTCSGSGNRGGRPELKSMERLKVE